MARVTDVRRRAATVQAVRRVLRGGADDATVRKVQRILWQEAYYMGPRDGIADIATMQAAREYDDEQERLASAERAPDVVEAAAGIVASRAVGQDRIAAAGIRDRLGAGDGGNMTIRAGTAGATGGRVALGEGSPVPPVVNKPGSYPGDSRWNEVEQRMEVYEPGAGWTAYTSAIGVDPVGTDRPKPAAPPPAPAKSPIGGVDRTKPRRLFRFLDEEQEDG